MNEHQIVAVLFGVIGTLLTAIGTWIATSLSKLNDNVGTLTVSVVKLNEKMETVVEKVNSHEVRLERIESKL